MLKEGPHALYNKEHKELKEQILKEINRSNLPDLRLIEEVMRDAGFSFEDF
jgi:hypothetical protein